MVCMLSLRAFHAINFHAFSRVFVASDDRWVLSGSIDGDARIWDVHDGLSHCSLLGHATRIGSADFCPLVDCLEIGDGKQISLRRY